MDPVAAPTVNASPFALLWQRSQASNCIDARMHQLMLKNLDDMGANTTRFAYQDDGVLRPRKTGEDWDFIKSGYSLLPQSLEVFAEVVYLHLQKANLTPAEVEKILARLKKAISNLEQNKNANYPEVANNSDRCQKRAVYDRAIKHLRTAADYLKNLKAIIADLKFEFEKDKSAYIKSIQGELESAGLNEEQERAKIADLVHRYGIIEPQKSHRFTCVPQMAKAPFEISFDRLRAILNQFETLAVEGKSERYLSACLIRHHELLCDVEASQAMLDDLMEGEADVDGGRKLKDGVEKDYAEAKISDLTAAKKAQENFVDEFAAFVNLFSDLKKNKQTFDTLTAFFENQFSAHKELCAIYKALESKSVESSKALVLMSGSLITVEPSRLSQQTKDVLVGSLVVGSTLTAVTVVGGLFPPSIPYLAGAVTVASPALGLAVTGKLGEAKDALFNSAIGAFQKKATDMHTQFEANAASDPQAPEAKAPAPQRKARALPSVPQPTYTVELTSSSEEDA